MGMTFAEKILARYSNNSDVATGQIVTVNPDHLLTHDNTAAIIQKIQNELEEFGIISPTFPIIVLDHVIPASSEKTALNHKIIRKFIQKYHVKHFYDVGSGVCHQIVIEKGLVLPGKLILGSDSHTCSYGAVGAFSSGIDRTEAASLLLTGNTWLKVPHSIKMILSGRLQSNVYAKDVILHIINDVSSSGTNYCSVEFHGDTADFSVDDRFTIANMGVEMGAKNTVFPFDDVIKMYYSKIGISRQSYDPIYPDFDAYYLKKFEYELDDIIPMIACPHSVDNVKPAHELQDLEIDQCLIGTCTNGRFSDLEIAAKILKGRHVHSKVRLLIIPASREIYRHALKSGFIDIFLQAGAILLPPGCGPCLGAHQGALAPEERCLSTSNRNFKGRMGCKEAEIYLASPATVAVSAITGKIRDPREGI